MVQNTNQAAYGMDEYPSGTNAVVAVISYTGFDMEDAMIISKSSYERGFGHGSVYKTLVRGRGGVCLGGGFVCLCCSVALLLVVVPSPPPD
jgi:hypothetical protein